MKWRTVLIVFLTILAAFLAFNYFQQPFLKKFMANYAEPTPEVPINPTPTIKKDLTNLSVEEIVAQLLMVPLTIETESTGNEATADEATAAAAIGAELAWIVKHQPGSVIYFGQEISFLQAKSQTEKLMNAFALGSLLPLIAVDHEGGTVQRLNGEGFTILPSMQELVASVDSADESSRAGALTTKMRARLFGASAVELAEAGINLVLAPMVDYAPGAQTILKTRLGRNPEAIKTIAQEYIRAFANLQIMPVLKHYPGIGEIKQDLHLSPATVTLKDEDTLIFEQLLDQYPNLGLMSSHLRLKDKLAGEPCSLSSECLAPVKKYYPQVLLITDDLTMASARYLPGTSQEKSLAEVAVAAVEAGNDILLFGKGTSATDLDEVLAALVFKYQDSQSFKALVDQAVAKILLFKN